MTAKLVKNMTDSDLLDMHYFLVEDDDLDNEATEMLEIPDIPKERDAE